VEVRRIGPVVGLGTWNTFGGGVDAAREVVAASYAAGTRLFDTSPMYRGAEGALGAALEPVRAEAIVATKIWANSIEEGREQFARQREWYGGRVEIEQVHNLVLWREHMEWLRAEQDAGRIDRLGVTHYQASAFVRLADAVRTHWFQVLQVPYNPWERDCERELLPLAAELGVAVIAMRPLGGSGQDRRRRIQLTEEQRAELGVESWPEALLRWALADERIDVVIPATSRPDRAGANARAGEGPRFTPAQRALVERLAAS
jgi:diketogulonate reductase-like aldo/keto reductase